MSFIVYKMYNNYMHSNGLNFLHAQLDPFWKRLTQVLTERFATTKKIRIYYTCFNWLLSNWINLNYCNIFKAIIIIKIFN
jgi:hypothetical protein